MIRIEPLHRCTGSSILGLLLIFFSGPVEAQVLEYVDLAGGALTIGQGYDSVAREPRGVCVEQPTINNAPVTSSVQFIGSTEETSADGGRDASGPEGAQAKSPDSESVAQEVFYSMDIVTQYEYERRFSQMGISAGGSYGGLVSAGGSYSETKESSGSDYSFHIVLTIEVRNKVKAMPKMKLCDDCARDTYSASSSGKDTRRGSDDNELPELDAAEEVEPNRSSSAAQDSRARSELVPPAICGDSFIYAIATGGMMHLVATVDTDNRRSMEQAMASVSAQGSYGGFSASASASFFSMVESASDYASTTVRLYTQGKWIKADVVFGSNAGNNQAAIEGLIGQALKFPDEVSGSAAWPYRGYLIGYSAAGDPGVSQAQLLIKSTISEQLFQAARRYWNLQKLVATIQADPSAFLFTEETVGKDDLPNLRQSYLEMWRRLVKSGGECQEIAEKCAIDENDPAVQQLYPTAETERLPKPALVSSQNSLCTIENDIFAFPGLVPAERGCFDGVQQNYWAGPIENVQLSVAMKYCETLGILGKADWRLPAPTEFLLLLSTVRQISALPRDSNVVLPKTAAVARLLGVGSSGGDESLVWAKTPDEEQVFLVDVLTKSLTPASADAGFAAAICISTIE